jgi:hypothetical protein
MCEAATMHKILGALALAAGAVSGPAVGPHPPHRSIVPSRQVSADSALERLGAYLGEWDGTGTMKATPYSQAGTVSAKTTCEWSPNHDFFVCDQLTQTPDGPGADLSVYTYDPTSGAYVFYELSRAGGRVRQPHLSIRDSTWTYEGSFTDRNGKHVKTRTVNVWTSPTVVTYTVEYSTDGTHWVEMGAGKAVRIK